MPTPIIYSGVNVGNINPGNENKPEIMICFVTIQ